MVFVWILKQILPARRGEEEETDSSDGNIRSLSHTEITTVAAPGLITFLDTALFKTYEGQLTATVSSANATLHAFLELRKRSKMLLKACISAPCPSKKGKKNLPQASDGMNPEMMDAPSCMQDLESFAQHCIDCSNEAIARLTTEKLSNTANLPPSNSNTNANANEYDSSDYGTQSSSSSSSSMDVAAAIRASKHDAYAEVATRCLPEHQDQWTKRDCWESKQLHCVDYVWGDEAVLQCQRLVRSMVKLDVVDSLLTMAVLMNQNRCGYLASGSGSDSDSADCSSDPDVKALVQMFENIMILLRHDLPMRLQQFRRGVESDIVVSKRLYLIKNEYRAPFRAFLEGHMHVQRAPSSDLIMEYVTLHQQQDDTKSRGGGGGGESHNAELKERRRLANQRIQDCLRNEAFVEAIQLEEICEGLEISMGNMLLPFCELARMLLDGKHHHHVNVRLVEVPGLLEGDKEVVRLYELLKRLKGMLLCRKTPVSGGGGGGIGGGISVVAGGVGGGAGETSIGIRPLLLDVQIPKGPTEYDPLCGGGSSSGSGSGSGVVPGSVPGYYSRSAVNKARRRRIMKERLDFLCSQLQCIHEVGKATRFGVEKKEMEALPTAIRACASFKSEKFVEAYTEWYDSSVRQRELSNGTTATTGGKKGGKTLYELSQDIRKAEIEVSIAKASTQALSMVMQRILHIETDRLKRFAILKEMVEECCAREMDIKLNLVPPRKDCILELPRIPAAPGLFHTALEASTW